MPTVLGTIDAGGDGRAILLSIINKTENKNLQVADFDFGNPQTPTVQGPLKNSIITITPKAGSGYYGARTVWYNRIHISEMGLLYVDRLVTDVMVSDLLPRINESYGVEIKPSDIIDVALPTDINTPADIQFSESSIIFYGGDKIVLGENEPDTGEPDTNFIPYYEVARDS